MPGMKRRRMSAKPTKAVVTKDYVRKAIVRAAEKKILYFTAGYTMKQQVVHSWNLMYQTSVAQGTDWEERVIGTKIRISRIIIEGQIANDVSSDKDQPFAVRVLVLKADNYNTITSLGFGDVFEGQIYNATDARPNSRKVTVLANRLLTLNQSGPASSEHIKPFSIEIKRGFPFEFKDLSISKEGRRSNLYFVVLASNLDGTIGSTSVGGISFRSTIEFTDL